MSGIVILRFINDGTQHSINIQPGFSANRVTCVMAGHENFNLSGTYYVDTTLVGGILCTVVPSANHWSEPVEFTISPLTNANFNFSLKDTLGNILSDNYEVTVTLYFRNV